VPASTKKAVDRSTAILVFVSVDFLPARAGSKADSDADRTHANSYARTTIIVATVIITAAVITTRLDVPWRVAILDDYTPCAAPPATSILVTNHAYLLDAFVRHGG
jgi:hypothetical protein